MDISQHQQQLSSSPTRFPDYCLSISTPLITHLISILPKQPNFTLSIGSGSGLLECLLIHNDASLSVHGVEVPPTVNKYITEEDMHVVGGGWALCPSAQHAAAWMFVYPRDPSLVTKYIQTHGDGSVEMVVWLGPRVDWGDYELCFRRSVFDELSFPGDVGLEPYEVMVVARKIS